MPVWWQLCRPGLTVAPAPLVSVAPTVYYSCPSGVRSHGAPQPHAVTRSPVGPWHWQPGTQSARLLIPWPITPERTAHSQPLEALRECVRHMCTNRGWEGRNKRVYQAAASGATGSASSGRCLAAGYTYSIKRKFLYCHGFPGVCCRCRHST
jgi:hypothetical protein